MAKRSNPKRDRVTVWEVSKKSGFSISTVSNVLNAPEIVAEETRVRVQKAIDELGYKPHAAARNLKSRRSHMIGFPIYQSGSASVMGEFFRELVVRANQLGYSVTTFTVEDGKYKQAFQKLVDQGAVDGFLLSEVTENDPRVRWLIEQKLKFAAFGRAEISQPYNYVDLDIKAGMKMLAEHVISTGHRDLAYVGWNGQPTNRFRKEGVEEALGQSLQTKRQVITDFSVEGGYSAAKTLLTSKRPPNAIICGHDIIAAGVLRAAKDLGISVGVDGLVVTGFDDTPISSATSPTLTSVRFPLGEIARNLVELFDSEAQGNSLITPELVVRESSS